MIFNVSEYFAKVLTREIISFLFNSKPYEPPNNIFNAVPKKEMNNIIKVETDSVYLELSVHPTFFTPNAVHNFRNVMEVANKLIFNRFL